MLLWRVRRNLFALSIFLNVVWAIGHEHWACRKTVHFSTEFMWKFWSFVIVKYWYWNPSERKCSVFLRSYIQFPPAYYTSVNDISCLHWFKHTIIDHINTFRFILQLVSNPPIYIRHDYWGNCMWSMFLWDHLCVC